MALELNGTTGVSAVQAGAVESGDLPAGSVIQVVHTNKDGRVTTSSTSPVATGYNISITPTSTSSRIIFYTTVRIDVDVANAARVSLFKNGNQVYSEVNATLINLASGTLGAMTDIYFVDNNITSTSSITYEVYVTSSGGNIYFGDGATRSDITAMEIAG